jgi:hypothetical protein
MAYILNTGAGSGGYFANVTVPNGGTTYTLSGAGVPINSVLSVSTGTSAPQWTTAGSWDTHSTLKVSGDTEISGNLKVKGRDITELFETIESRLAILQPNPELEKEFDELKALGDAYREAEKKFIDQKKVFEILKKQDE